MKKDLMAFTDAGIQDILEKMTPSKDGKDMYGP